MVESLENLRAIEFGETDKIPWIDNGQYRFHGIWSTFELEYAKNPMYKIPNTYCTEEFSKDEIEKTASEVFKGFYFRFNYIVFNYIFRIFNFSMFKVHLAAALKIVFKRL